MHRAEAIAAYQNSRSMLGDTAPDELLERATRVNFQARVTQWTAGLSALLWPGSEGFKGDSGSALSDDAVRSMMQGYVKAIRQRAKPQNEVDVLPKIVSAALIRALS